jgi:hypothetical protein
MKLGVVRDPVKRIGIHLGAKKRLTISQHVEENQ